MTKPDFESVALDLMLAHLSDYPDPLKNSVSRIKSALEQAYDAGRTDERERCAKIADAHGMAHRYVAIAIRNGDEE